MSHLRRRDLFLAGTGTFVAKLLCGQSANSVNRQSLIDDLVIANHILAAHNIVDGFGHASVRSTPGAQRYLISRSLAPASVTAPDIVELDLDNKPVVADNRTLYKERFIHSEIYRARPDVMG